MDKKIKDFLQAIVLGGGVVILTPIVGGFINGLLPDIMSFSLAGFITVGTAISAGISAFGLQYAINSYWK